MCLELCHWSWVTVGTALWSSALVWVARGLPLSEIYGTLGVCSFFSVASVLCLARSDVLVEFPFAWSFCTTISLTESLLFPQQSCQEVVLWYLFILLLTFLTQDLRDRLGGWNFFLLLGEFFSFPVSNQDTCSLKRSHLKLKEEKGWVIHKLREKRLSRFSTVWLCLENYSKYTLSILSSNIPMRWALMILLIKIKAHFVRACQKLSASIQI